MKKALSLVLAISCAAPFAFARPVPEISSAVLPTALALLGGGVLVVRAYLKK